MSQVMVIGILVLFYIFYLLAGINFHFPVGWLDWNSPYWHYAIAGSKEAISALAIPVVLEIWLGYLWYKKSMIGEA